MKRELLDDLQEACNLITNEYQKETGNHQTKICVLQLLKEKYPDIPLKTDLVRQAAGIYDEYEGNEDYIHIPDLNQMLHLLQQYPVLGAIDIETGELEGVLILKYHENFPDEEVDPCYPKKGAKYFDLKGTMVKQNKNVLHTGIGNNLDATALLGLHKYASKHPDENIEARGVIDCTNLQSLYMLSKANRKVQKYIGQNKRLPALLEGIYTIRDENGHLVEAPTYVFSISLVPEDLEQTSETTFTFERDQSKPKHQQYEALLDTILEKIKVDKTCTVTHTKDEDTRELTSYIHVDNLGINMEDIKLERNGAHEIGNNRVPRGDVSKFVGPMPDFTVNIEEDIDDR